MAAPDGPTLVERARALQPLVAGHADASEAQRHLAAPVAEAMAAAGLHRAGAPAAYGGSDAAPRHQVEMIEAVAAADGSAGWNVMIGVESFAIMALGWRGGAELFADPATIVCGSTAAVGRADAVDGGWRVTGRWSWASGCHHAHWFGGIVHAFDGAGRQVTGRRPVYAFVPRGEFEIVDTWHTAGLRGSGSHDIAVDDVFVPHDRVALHDDEWVDRMRTESTLARIPLGPRLGHNKTAVALGIARAAVDEFVELATGKVPAFGSIALAERPYAQRALATAEARLRSGRAWVLEQCDEVWATAEAGDAVTDRQKALFMMACSDAPAGCVEAVEAVVEAAGTTPNMTGGPLDRRRRDVTVVRSHLTVAPHLREEAGALLLGQRPESFLFQLP